MAEFKTVRVIGGPKIPLMRQINVLDSHVEGLPTWSETTVDDRTFETVQDLDTTVAGLKSVYIIPVTPDYVGPGDIITVAPVGFWGLRAFSAATIGSNCIRLIRASDSAQQDFVTLSDGTVDVASITTFLADTTGKVVTWYDQSGNGLHATQGTDGIRPLITLSVLNGLPSIDSNVTYELVTDTVGTLTGGNFVSSVVFSAASASNYSWFGDSGGGHVAIQFTSSANTLGLYGGSLVTVAGADNAWLAVQTTINGASSELIVNGGTPATGDCGASTLTGALHLFSDGYNTFSDISMMECGVWNSLPSSGQKSSMNSNQRAFWGI